MNKLYKFFYGRNGFDELNKFIFYLYFVIFIVNIFFNNVIVSYVELGIFILLMYRVLSKNLYLRRRENRIYLNIINKIKKKKELIKNKWKDRKTHKYKRCSYCKQMCRLSLRKGKHKAKCPSCGKSFNVRCFRNPKIEVIKKAR